PLAFCDPRAYGMAYVLVDELDIELEHGTEAGRLVARWPCDVGSHHCCGHSVGVRKDPHTCGGIKAVGACACFQRRIDCGGNLLSTFRGGRDIETSISGTDTGRAYLNRDGVPTPIRLTN